MSILLANYIVSLIIAFFTCFDKKASRVAVFFMFVCVFIIHAFADIGSLEDLTAYSAGFEEIKRMSVWQCVTTDVEICKMERGFAFLLKIFSLLGLNFRAFLIVNSYFISVVFYRSILRHSPAIVLSALLFLLIINNQSVYVIRQYLVVAIFFNSLKWIIERNPWKYILTCVICFFIHQSSIILLPVYFLYSLDLKKLLVVLFLLGVGMWGSFAIIVEYFGSILVGYTQYAQFDGTDGQNAVGLIISIVYLLMYVLILRKRIYDEGLSRLVFICAVLNTMLLYIGVGFGFASRLSLYFNALNVFLVPIAITKLKNLPVRVVIVCGCLILNTILAFKGSVFVEASNVRLLFFN